MIRKLLGLLSVWTIGSLFVNGQDESAIVSTGVQLGYTTLFSNQEFPVDVQVEWADVSDLNRTATWKGYINGDFVESGIFAVGNYSELIISDDKATIIGYVYSLGSLVAPSAGETTVEIEVCVSNEVDCSTSSASLQTIGEGVSLIPLILIIFLAIWTKHVEVSLAFGIFVGACIVNGSLVQGFNRFLDTYLLGAVADGSNQMVILFTFFISGLVGMIEKAGGIKGMTTVLLKYATSRRRTQLVALLAGLIIFFDDYSNCLVVGFSMRSLFDPSSLSREKLAFITDATSAPIASIVPISSWVGFELDQIQTQLDAIKEDNGGVMPDGLSGSAFTVFIESIPYRYYPFFMLFFQLVVVLSEREFGPMLIAERLCKVHSRTDGGRGAFKGNVGLEAINAPVPGTPGRAWNMFLPIGFLITLIVAVMVNVGIEGSGPNPSVQEIFENTDSYQGLLVGSFGASLLTALFFAIQFKRSGKLTRPTMKAFFRRNAPKEVLHSHTVTENLVQACIEDDVTRPIMGVMDSVESWLKGIQRIFPAIVVLCLAWATGDMMEDSGANRFFQDAIESNLTASSLPTITFIMSSLMALATGTSWGTMEIVFPIVVLPAWRLSGSPDLVIAVIAAVLSGAVAGDHVSFISDTTVLSSIAAGCDLTRHVVTQAPYAGMMMLWSMLAGTLPIGMYYADNGGYNNGAALAVGFALVLVTIFGLGVPVINKTGRYDILTEFYLVFCKKVLKRPDQELEELKEATVLFAQGAHGKASPENETSYDDNAKTYNDKAYGSETVQVTEQEASATTETCVV